MADETTVTGGCLCGAIRYTCDRSAVVTTNNCHCRDCQRSTGSGFTTFFALPEASFELESGELGSFAVTGSSGSPLTRMFCRDCGSPIYSRTDLIPALVFVKAGSLDDPAWVTPQSSYWGKSAQPWAPPSDDIPVLDGNPT